MATPWGDVEPSAFEYAPQVDDDRKPFDVTDPDTDAPIGAIMMFDQDGIDGWWQRQAAERQDRWVPIADPQTGDAP